MLRICLALVLAIPAVAPAAIVNFAVTGTLQGAREPGAAAADIFAVTPIGSGYSFTFSYDTDTAKTLGGPTYGTYANLPIAGKLTFGPATFDSPTANVATGVLMGPRFALFNDVVPFQANRLAGYQLLDFSLNLFGQPGALPDGNLPSSFELGRFPSRYLDARFAFGPNGSTRLTYGVDSIVASAAAAVPEPETWQIMIASFLLLGLMQRRRARGVLA